MMIGMKKTIGILGSTGSIGQSTLEVIRGMNELFDVAVLVAGSDAETLIKQSLEFNPRVVAIYDESKVSILKTALPNTEILAGESGIIEAAANCEVDIVVCAIVGAVGLQPVLAAIRAGKRIALANKEPLVMAGKLVMSEAEKYNATIIPVDSEHSAIFQCLVNNDISSVSKLLITASGGPLRSVPINELANVTPEVAMQHPTWSMGEKITIDSATMANKALEVIEAHWLFNIPFDKIKVKVHPQSIVHSMVEFVDGSVIAQLGIPSMRLPIQYALTYPKRIAGGVVAPNFVDESPLEFFDVDFERFPLIKAGYEAGKAGGTLGAVFNAANEIAVNAFLKKCIQFNDIYYNVRKVMDEMEFIQNPTLDDLIKIDKETRERLSVLIDKRNN